MYYFVISEDGTRYGPADIDTLLQWVREGRLIESTVLVERGTERAVRAEQITALQAEFRRIRGQSPAVTVERAPYVAEPATMTHPGDPRNTGAGCFPTAPGAPPPVPAEFQNVTGPGGVPQARHLPTMPYADVRNISHRSKLAAGLLGIFLGGFGVHRFYLGHISIGIIQIVVTLVSCGWGSIWGFIEGILCLTGHIRDAEGLPLRD